MLSYSIIHNKVGFKNWVPALPTQILYHFRRFLPHGLNKVEQFFYEPTLPKCHSHAVICSHIRVYVEIFLNMKILKEYLRAKFINDMMLTTHLESTYPHLVENFESFTRSPCLAENCQEFCIDKPGEIMVHH